MRKRCELALVGNKTKLASRVTIKRETCLRGDREFRSIADGACFSSLTSTDQSRCCSNKKNLSIMRILSNGRWQQRPSELSHLIHQKAKHRKKATRKFKTQQQRQQKSNFPLFNNQVNYPTHAHDITFT